VLSCRPQFKRGREAWKTTSQSPHRREKERALPRHTSATRTLKRRIKTMLGDRADWSTYLNKKNVEPAAQKKARGKRATFEKSEQGRARCERGDLIRLKRGNSARAAEGS